MRRDYREKAKVDVLLELANGRLEVKRTRVGVFGGRVSADGTALDLAAAPLKYDLVARLEGLRGESLFATVADLGDAITGRLDSELRLAGSGFTVESLSRSLSGAFDVALQNGRLDGVNLVAATVTPLRDALSFAASTGRLGISEDLETGFRRLAGRFEVERG
ncbi:MAG: AsmA-like C-terminal region-containing protein, partial [Myxococcota bacterium]